MSKPAGKDGAAKDKKKKPEKAPPAIDITTTHLVCDEDSLKIVHCAFHQVLPWLALTPKHGHKAIVWDYAAGKQICELPLLELLSAQQPHPNAETNEGATASAAAAVAAGSWTVELAGRILYIQFLDENCLMWQRFLAQNHVRPTTTFSEGLAVEMDGQSMQDEAAKKAKKQAASTDTPLFGQVGPHHDSTEEQYFTTLATQLPTAQQSDGFGGGTGSSGSEGTRDTSLLVVAQNVALVVSVGTSTIHRTLINANVANRVICSVLTLPVVGAGNPIVVMGCTDGCMMLWDPIRAIAQRDSQEVEEGHGLTLNQGALLKRDCLSIHLTPTTQPILCMSIFLFVQPKACTIEDLMRIDIEGASTFRGAYLSIIIGTESGGVALLKFYNRDENDAIFTVKKVHDEVLSVCSSPQSPQEKNTDAGYVYQPDCTPTEYTEFLNSLAASSFIYSLGPHNIIQHDPRTGAEIRKIKIQNLGVRSLMQGSAFLLMIAEEGKIYTVSYDLNQASTQKLWIDVESLVARSQQLATTGANAGPGGAAIVAQSQAGRSKSSSVVPIHKQGQGTLDALLDFEADLKLYEVTRHSLLPNTVIAFCTNAGLIVGDIAVRRAGDIALVQPLPKLLPRRGVSATGEDSRSAAASAVSAYTSMSAMAGVVGADGLTPEERYEFVYCEGSTGKAATATLKISLNTLLQMPNTGLILPLIGETAAGQSVAASASARRNEHIVNRIIVSETNPTFKVIALIPSPNGALVAALTDVKEVQLYDASHGFTVLQVPSTVRADTLVWSSTSLAFAVMTYEPRRISVVNMKKVPAARGHSTYSVSPTTYDIMPANIPITISGGRWLCVHYQASFSGLSSQFYRWDSPMAGGGAVGGFLPQPLFLRWDRMATLCAMAYSTCIVFMEARRKVFTKINAVDVATPPTDIMFCNKALFVMFEREIMMLLPTRNIVQKIIIASINPALVTQTLELPRSDGGPMTEGAARRAKASQKADSSFSYKAALRPPGKLNLKGVIRRVSPDDPEQHVFALVVADEALQCFVLPMSNSLAQLLFYIHSYTSLASNAAERLFVQKRILNAVQAGQGHRATMTNSMFTVAVYRFCSDCGCDVLMKAADVGLINNITSVKREGGEEEVLTADETAIVDLRCVDAELNWLTQRKIFLKRQQMQRAQASALQASPFSRPSVPADSKAASNVWDWPRSDSDQEVGTIMTQIVRKLLEHAAEIHAGGWITEDVALRAAFDAISAAAQRLKPASPSSSSAQARFRDPANANFEDATAGSTAHLEKEAWKFCRYEVLMDVAFELFQHLPVC